jgi:adenine-specific DNA-methyltransferase
MKRKLELTWVGKEERPRLEPRLLVEEDRWGDEGAEPNLLIQGDNLLALKALEADYAGRVKCVFVDPPYNTGSAFEYYEDGLEHSIWLAMMRDRLEVIRNLLSDDGSLWVTLDDNEAHYFKVMADEVFGRSNVISAITWVKRVSPANDAKYISSDHDSVTVYAKDKLSWTLNRFPRTDKPNSYYKNPDKDPRGDWNSFTYTGNRNRSERPNLWYPIVNPNTSEEIYPPDGLTWRYGPETHAGNEKNGLLYWGKDGKSRTPRMKMFLSTAHKIVPRSVWPAEEVGSTQTAMMEQKALSSAPFPTPKPEGLIARILTGWRSRTVRSSGTARSAAAVPGARPTETAPESPWPAAFMSVRACSTWRRMSWAWR